MSEKRLLRVNKAISFESTQTSCTDGASSVLLTGSAIEEADDVYRTAKYRCKYSSVSTRARLHEPILLRQTTPQRACVVTLPPPRQSPIQEAVHVLHQPLNIGLFRLTASAENKVYVSELHVGSFGAVAKRQFVLNAPVREVHWELCPPTKTIERESKADTNRRVAQLMLCPTDILTAQEVRIKWMYLHYTIAYGRHFAVPTCIAGPQFIKIKKLRAIPRKSHEIQVHRLIPPVPIMFKQLLRAPPIQEIALKATNSGEPREVVRVTADDQVTYGRITRSRSSVTFSSYATYSEQSDCRASTNLQDK